MVTSHIAMLRGTYFDVHFPAVIACCCALPLFGLFFCETWTVLYDFEALTSTKCSLRNAQNFLPSISAAIGGRTPQRYVWQVCIALHTTPRFLIAWGYLNMHRLTFSPSGTLVGSWALSLIVFWLHITEIVTLLGLTVFPSTQDYAKHAMCFSIFMLSSMIHMCLMCWLHTKISSIRHYKQTHQELSSLRVKKMLTIFQLCVFFAAVFFFQRHNTYCEDGVYSLFGLSEIIIVITNIAFHGTAIWDFGHTSVTLQDLDTGR